MPDPSNNPAVLKAAFVSMSATEGWRHFARFAEQAIAAMERQVIDEPDDVKANGLRRDARGARRFWGILQASIECAKSQDRTPAEEFQNFIDQFYAILETQDERPANTAN